MPEIKLSPTTEDNLPEIAEWIKADPYHKDNNVPDFWLTGNGNLLAFNINDADGILCYVRLDMRVLLDTGDYSDLTRLHGQFSDTVPKQRLIAGMAAGFSVVVPYLIEQGLKGIVYESVSPLLIRWLAKQGFKSVLATDDFVLMFPAAVEPAIPEPTASEVPAVN